MTRKPLVRPNLPKWAHIYPCHAPAPCIPLATVSPHSSAISPSDTEESLIKGFGMYTCLIWLTVLSMLVNSLIFIILSWFRIEPMWISEYCWIAWYSLLGQIPYCSICWDNWCPCHGIRELRLGFGSSLFVCSCFQFFIMLLPSVFRFVLSIGIYISTWKSRLYVREDVE